MTELNRTAQTSPLSLQSIGQKLSDVASFISREASHQYGDLGDQAKVIGDKSVAFVKKYPVYSVLGAASLGFVVGIMIRRRNS